jgi:hypothetical protein
LKVNWVIDEYILESRSTVGDLCQAVLDSGAGLHRTKYVPFADDQDYGHFTEKECVVLYGTHGFLKKCKTPFIPGAFGVNPNTSCNVYYSYIPVEMMLNSHYFYLPWSHIRDYTTNVFGLVGKTEFFVRPISGYKTFAGFVVDWKDYEFELKSSQQLSSVTSETICLVAPVKKLLGEFRFIIGDGEVIDGSEYRWDEKLDIRHDWPKECWKVADTVAKLPWQLDRVYTCDVALTGDGPRVVELNSFACAGLYATDKNLVVNRINEIAMKEFKGEYDV